MDRKLNLYLKQRDPIGAAELLADKQAVAKILVDRQAGAARGRFITVAAGQEMVYQQKAAEAAAAQAVIDGGGTPVEADYPHLAAEIGTTAADLDGVAAVVLEKRAQWIAVSAEIESLRSEAKAAIDAAADASAIRAAVAGIAWPKPV